MRRIAQWLLGGALAQCERANQMDLPQGLVRVTDGISVVTIQLRIVCVVLLLGGVAALFDLFSWRSLVSVLSGISFVIVFSCLFARRYFRVGGARQAKAMCSILWGAQLLKMTSFIAFVVLLARSGTLDALLVVLSVAVTQSVSAWMGFGVYGNRRGGRQAQKAQNMSMISFPPVRGS